MRWPRGTCRGGGRGTPPRRPRYLARRGGVYFHGAACVLLGRRILLLADSGVGKTTLSRLVVAGGGSCLTDEHPFVTRTDGRVVLHGSPWPGPLGSPAPLSGPLAAVFFLRQAPANELRRLGQAEAGRQLVANTRFFRWEATTIPATVELLDAMATELPTYDLGFVPDLPAVEARGGVL